MKVELNVAERLTLMSVLPREGNFVTLKVLRETNDKLGLSEEELKFYEVEQDEDKVHWNPDKDKGTELEFGDRATDIIVDALKNLDKSKKLTQRHFTLYDKFVRKGE